MHRDSHGHVDDWLMTYADMITLLLCFFAVFLAISLQKKELPHTAAMTQALPPPVQPVAMPAPPVSVTRVARSDTPAQPPAAPPAPKAKQEAPPAPTAAAPPPAAVRDITPPPELADLLSAAAPAALPASAAPSANTLQPPAPSPQPDGDRITQLEMSSAAFFDSGSATLSKSGEAILQKMAVQLKSEKFRDYNITVEGHTDDTPINTPRFPSNWELSTARAAAVVHFFLEQGIPAQKLRAAGYADTFPKAPNRDANGNPIPANQSLNRRVVITLEKIDRAQHPQE